MSASKILVVGAVQGELTKAFQKISKLHTKQSFSFAIIVGDLFAAESSEQSEAELKNLVAGVIKVPLPTYFTVGDHGIPDSVQNHLEATGEVTTNLFFLGRKGTLKTTEGIRIVNLGGRLVQNEASLTQKIGKYDPLYTEAEAKGLRGAHSADILITNQWPASIGKNSRVPIPDTIEVAAISQQCIADLSLALRPRYHFASTPLSIWSREPFMMAPPAATESRQLKSYDDLDGPVRFTSLASIQSSNKECLSAFSLDPTKPAPADGAQSTCPLESSSALSKRKRGQAEDSAPQNYRYDRDSQSGFRGHEGRRGGRGGKNNKRQKNYDPSSCFMCMSNEAQFDTSMLVSIAEESILTVVKGPLSVRGQTFPVLKSSGHILIIPMYHAADEASHGLRLQSDLEKEFTEMTQYRHCLQRFLGSKGLGAVCWEVNRTGIRHFHWQLIACPLEVAQSGMAEAAYKVAAERYKIRPSHSDTTNPSSESNGGDPDHAIPLTFTPCDPDKLIAGQRSDFFRVWIWSPTGPSSVSNQAHNPSEPDSNSKSKTSSSPIATADALSNGDSVPSLPTITGNETSMYFPIPPSLSFNIAFGREVMASLLQLEQRSDWRTVPAGNGMEAEDAQAFQEEFQRPLGEGKEGWDFAMG